MESFTELSLARKNGFQELGRQLPSACLLLEIQMVGGGGLWVIGKRTEQIDPNDPACAPNEGQPQQGGADYAADVPKGRLRVEQNINKETDRSQGGHVEAVAHIHRAIQKSRFRFEICVAYWAVPVVFSEFGTVPRMGKKRPLATNRARSGNGSLESRRLG